MNYIFFQITRAIGVFFRTLRAFFARKIMGVGARLRRLTNFSRHATKAATSSLQGVMTAAQKPTQPSDYVETGRLYISKALIVRVLVGLVALVLIIYFVIWPFVLSRFLTARFYEEDKRVKDWSGRVIVYSDKKKKLPLFSGRLEDGVLQGECKQYDREGVLLFEGQLRDGQRTGSGKEYENGILTYEGQYDAGYFSGRGKRYADGQLVYDGQYDAGMRSGSGTAYEDGTILYRGQFLDDLYEGRGKLYQNGDLCYDGGFHAGVPEGSGTVYADGRLVFEGQFVNGLYEGRGKEYVGGVLRYDGSFHTGVPEGTGTAYYPSGRIAYQGSYLAGKPDGQGTSYGENGRKTYDGGFSEGEPSGLGTLFFDDGSQLEATFESGQPTGTVDWKKDGFLYYRGQWAEDGPAGFGTLYGKSGKKLYEGPFRGGTIDGYSLLNDSPEQLRSAFCESDVRSESVGDGYRILARELGIAALCTFQTEDQPSTIYQIYLSAPEKDDWVSMMPGMAHTQSVPWPEGALPQQRTIRFAGEVGVSVPAGSYFAENAAVGDRRITALYTDETRSQAALLTWVRSDVTPTALDWGSGDGDGSLEGFLGSLDGMDSGAGADLGGGAVFGSENPDGAFEGIAGAAEAASLTDAMLRYWEMTEQMNALNEASARIGVLLEDARDLSSKGLASDEYGASLEQAQLELSGQIEACRTEQKRAELQAGDLGVKNLGDYALSEMLVDFDPSEQDVAALTLVATAYAQATGSEADASAVQNAVKEGLLDLMDAYGQVKLAMARYQALETSTRNQASAYAMGVGSKDDWYRAMNDQTLGRGELCSALAAYSRLASEFNQLTGGWVSRTFGWHWGVFEPLFLAEMLPVEVFVGKAEEAAAKAGAEVQTAKAAARAADAAVQTAALAVVRAEGAAQAAAEAAQKASEIAQESDWAAEMAERAAQRAAEAAQVLPAVREAAEAAAAAAEEAAQKASATETSAVTATLIAERTAGAANSAEAAPEVPRAEAAAADAAAAGAEAVRAAETAAKAQAAAEAAAKEAENAAEAASAEVANAEAAAAEQAAAEEAAAAEQAAAEEAAAGEAAEEAAARAAEEAAERAAAAAEARAAAEAEARAAAEEAEREAREKAEREAAEEAAAGEAEEDDAGETDNRDEAEGGA